MSKYTTGEIAKICGVTVRTVQYYDSRGILIPSELSEGGRRHYNDDDVRTLKVICFLRDMGLSINTVSQILKDKDQESVVELLIDEHEKALTKELSDVEKKLESVKALKKEIKFSQQVSVSSLSDIATIMKSNDKMKRFRRNFLLMAFGVEAIEILTLIPWILKGIWWPFAVYTALELIFVFTFMLPYYFKKVSYICPTCHETFKPTYWQMFFANHTYKTRRLMCPHCNEKKWCVEVYDESSDKNNNSESE